MSDKPQKTTSKSKKRKPSKQANSKSSKQSNNKRHAHSSQGNRLLSLESQFKEMRIKQIEGQVQEYLAYFHKHNHFLKVHPLTGEVLKDTNGLPIMINIPSLLKEIIQLKETITFSEGLDKLVDELVGVFPPAIDKEKVKSNVGSDYTLPTVTSFDGLFKKF